MLKFRDYLTEASEFKDGGLTIFDIDDTLFHTTAKILVKKNGEVVHELTNQQFNTYQLKSGEEFDFSQFRSADYFAQTSKPITKMINRLNAILGHVSKKEHSKVIMLTARANFDKKDVLLDAFRKYFNVDQVRIERAGNITDIESVDVRKYVIIANYLNTKQYRRVRLFDDSMANLKTFLKLKVHFPMVKFEAYLAQPDGSVKEIK